MSADLSIQPDLQEFAALVHEQPGGTLLDRAQSRWREQTRRELHLAVDRPIIATGHQTLLWHPGILAKYLVVDAIASKHDFATANLIVDQHVDHFGDVEIPLRREDGSLAVQRLMLTSVRKDVPMGLQPAFTAEAPRRLRAAIPAVDEGLSRIVGAVNTHRDAPNAAIQMARALDDLMKRWVAPMPGVTATDLISTSLGRAMLEEMSRDPLRMAEAYNRAVRSMPEAGIPSLLVRDDYVETPLWRIQPDGRRVRAYDNDVQAWLEVESLADRARLPFRGLLPRALFMTALVRLGMCDLFVHGTGGANYDRAMERWIDDWLGVEVGHIAIATATLRLPLESGPLPDVDEAIQAARRAWHDPENALERRRAAPGPEKRALLARIDQQPRGSIERRRAFHAMHEALERLREANAGALREAADHAEEAVRRRADAAIASRRDWAFPLYRQEQIDDLAAQVRRAVDGRAPAPACAGECHG